HGREEQAGQQGDRGRPRPRPERGGLEWRAPADRLGRGGSRAPGRREDRGRRQCPRAHRGLPRAAQGHLSPKVGAMAIEKIWVFAEADGDKAASSTLEMLTKARELAGTVEAVHVGTSADVLAPALGEHGASTVYAVDPGAALPGVGGAAALPSLMDEHGP